MNIKFEVNPEFLDLAEQQVFEILSQRRLAFNDRWMTMPFFVKAKPILRRVGLVLSIIGVIISALPILFGEAGSTASIKPELFVFIFLLLGLFFYYLPWVEARAINWTRGFALNSCKKVAAKSMKFARKLAPYSAEYDIKGGVASYYREKQGELNHVWTRKIRGVAIQNDCATVLFRRWTSFTPKMVILHLDSELIKQALSKQNIESVRLDAQILEKYNSGTH